MTQSSIGTPFMKCSNCHKLCSSGKLPWSQLNITTKIVEITMAIIKGLLRDFTIQYF